MHPPNQTLRVSTTLYPISNRSIHLNPRTEWGNAVIGQIRQMMDEIRHVNEGTVILEMTLSRKIVTFVSTASSEEKEDFGD